MSSIIRKKNYSQKWTYFRATTFLLLRQTLQQNLLFRVYVWSSPQQNIPYQIFTLSSHVQQHILFLFCLLGNLILALQQETKIKHHRLRHVFYNLPKPAIISCSATSGSINDFSINKWEKNHIHDRLQLTFFYFLFPY